jgi:hypothetical protein
MDLLYVVYVYIWSWNSTIKQQNEGKYEQDDDYLKDDPGEDEVVLCMLVSASAWSNLALFGGDLT